MDRFLRKWREDAASRLQYDSAIFIGDKVLALTGDKADAIRLAELHYATGNFARALTILTRSDLVSKDIQCQHLAGLCHVKQGKFDDAIAVLGERSPAHLLSNPRSRAKLARLDHSATTKQGKPNQKNVDPVQPASASEVNNVRIEAAMCYLRGLCYAKQNAMDRAKECYKDAVKIDVQCFEAFDQLMKNALMTPAEEWEFLDELDFDSIATGNVVSTSQEAADLTKMLYTSRLSKYKEPEEFMTAVETLSTHYKLANNPDLLLSRAELLFTQCKFKEALSFTTTILENDRYNFAALPLHLACLHELSEKNALFLLSHDFADKHPEEPATWLAVGVYYLSIGKIAEARRFFSKASMMDPHFGPAWIGFAHTFAAEGEHDQAISAYSTAARLYQGTHLPQLFLGMQNLQLQNVPLASEYLKTAYALCDTDPLVLNELAIVYYHDNQLEDAIGVFQSALNIAAQIGAEPRSFVATRANLGHAYRRSGMWKEALSTFDEVLRIVGRDPAIFTAKAMVLLELGQAWDAIVALHEALAINPQDPVASDLLVKALDETAAQGTEFPIMPERDVEDLLQARKQDSKAKLARGRTKQNESFVEQGGGASFTEDAAV